MSEFAEHIWSTICQQAQSRKLFYRTFNEQLPYSQLKKTIERLSGFFQQNNSPKKIAIMSGNDQIVAEIMLACSCNDITYTVMDKEAKSNRVNALLSQFSPDITFVDEAYTDLIISGTVIKINPTTSSNLLNKLSNKFFNQNEQQNTYPNLLQQVVPSSPKSFGQKVAYILYTSGTTAEPKGVVITNEALFSHLKTLKKVFSYDSDVQILNSLNLSHADGLIQGPLLVAYLGAGWSSIGQYSIAETEKIFDIITAHQASHFITVPIVLSLIDKLAKYDDIFSIGNFKTIISTGGHLDKQTWVNIERKFKTKVTNIYGLTETTAGGIFAGPNADSRIPGTVGKAVDLKFVIGKSPEKPSKNGTGLLWLKGDSLMKGYYNNENATNLVMYHGWLNTGDIAKLENGLISIIGREKLLANIGGYAVHPQEINEILLQEPNVTLAYTTTKKDPIYGDYLVSIVAANKDVDSVILTTRCRSNLEPHKVPRYIYIEDALPIGPSGKVLVNEAEKLISQLDMSVEQSNTHETLINLAARVFNIDAEQLSITSGVHNTPGWDSLGHLMLVAEIEQQFSILLTPNQIMQIEKLTDFEALIQ